METTYRVLIKGTKPDADANSVREAIAKRFKISLADAGRVLDAKSHVVKGGLTMSKALQYRTAIEAAGANCIIEPETQNDPDIQLIPAVSEKPTESNHSKAFAAENSLKLVYCWSCKESLQDDAAYCHGCGAFQRTIISQSVESLSLQLAQSNPLTVVGARELVAADQPLSTQESILLAKYRVSDKLAANQFAGAANAEFDKRLIPMLRTGAISARFIDLWLDYWAKVDAIHAACTEFLLEVAQSLGRPFLSQSKSSNSLIKSLIEAGQLVVPELNPVKKRGMIFDPIAMNPEFGKFVDLIGYRLDSASNRIQTGESDVRQLLAWRISTEIDSSRLNEVLFRLKMLRRFYSARVLGDYDPGELVGMKFNGLDYGMSTLFWTFGLSTTELANAGKTLIDFDEYEQDKYFHSDKKTSETIGERFDEIDASIDSLINDTGSGFQIIGDPTAWLESKLIGVPCLSADEINVLIETDLSELSELVKKSRVGFDASIRILLEAILKKLTDQKQDDIALKDAMKLESEHAQQAKTFAAELVKQQQRAHQLSEGKFYTAAITDIFGVAAGATIEGLTRREK